MKLPPPVEIGPITRTDIVRYQGASGDMNPVHHDEPFAREAGYPAPLVVGMYPAGALVAWAADFYGPENLRRVRLRWKAPVFPGDRLQFRAEEISGGELHLTATRGEAVVVEAWTTFTVA